MPNVYRIHYPELPPGRELDRLVAVVFGWKPWKFKNPSRTPGMVAFEYETLVPPEYDGSDSQHLNMIIPHYSTDPTEAMRAWDWLEKNNPWDDGIVLYRPKPSNKPTVAKVYAREGMDYDVFIQGETYPHAIALAIVETGKAKGIIE